MGFSCRVAVFGIGCAMVLGGCVSSGTYQLKEQESQMLSKNLEESRNSNAELQRKFNQLQVEKADLESELKKQRTDLGDSAEKNQKLLDTNVDLTDRVNKLAADLADAKSDNEKLGATNGELSEKLKKLALDFVEIKNDRDKVTLANLALSGKINRLSSEMSELKAANEKLSTAVKPENLLKTVGEYFESLQQKLDGLGAENTRLKLTILEMRGSGRLKGAAETSSRTPEEKTGLPASAGEKTPAAQPVATQPAAERQRPVTVQNEKSQPVPPAVEKVPPAQPVVKPHAAVKNDVPPRETEKAGTEEAPTTFFIPGEEPIAVPQSDIR